jgi:hypothetical protein
MAAISDPFRRHRGNCVWPHSIPQRPFRGSVRHARADANQGKRWSAVASSMVRRSARTSPVSHRVFRGIIRHRAPRRGWLNRRFQLRNPVTQYHERRVHLFHSVAPEYHRKTQTVNVGSTGLLWKPRCPRLAGRLWHRWELASQHQPESGDQDDTQHGEDPRHSMLPSQLRPVPDSLTSGLGFGPHAVPDDELPGWRSSLRRPRVLDCERGQAANRHAAPRPGPNAVQIRPWRYGVVTAPDDAGRVGCARSIVGHGSCEVCYQRDLRTVRRFAHVRGMRGLPFSARIAGR